MEVWRNQSWTSMKGSLTCVGHVLLECVSRTVSGKKVRIWKGKKEWWPSKLQVQNSLHYTSPELVEQRARQKVSKTSFSPARPYFSVTRPSCPVQLRLKGE